MDGCPRVLITIHLIIKRAPAHFSWFCEAKSRTTVREMKNVSIYAVSEAI